MLAALLLALVTCAAFGSAFRGGFVWDDDQHLVDNTNLRSAAGLWQIWINPASSPQYYPLVHTSWWIEYHLWGLDPRGYHAVNVFLHVANALLLWRLLARLRVPGAWFAALFFAIHPVQVETVAWAMERKNLLSCLFYLLSFQLLLPLLSDGRGATPRRFPKGRYAAALALFLCALLSKSVAATLPAAFLLVAWWREPALLRRGRLWLQMLPFFAVGMASGLFTAWLERSQVGAAGPEYAFSCAERFYIAGRALWSYLGKLAWPHPLMLFYPRWPLPPRPWQYFFPLAFLALLVVLWLLRGRAGRGALAGLLFFAGTIFPALGFINVYPMRYSFFADHFQYMACIGPLALLAAGLAILAARPALATLAGAVRILLVAAWVPLTFVRGTAYRDATTLYLDLVRKNPSLWAGHTLLAQERMKAGQYPQAAAEFERAMHLAPELADNQEGLANALLLAGQPERALPLLEDLVEHDRPIGVKDRSRATLYNDYANCLSALKRPDEAIRNYKEALARDPNLAYAHFNLAEQLAAVHQFAPAAEHYIAALSLRPAWPEAALKAGASLADAGRLAEAVPYFERAVELRPGWPPAEQALREARDILSHR